MLILTRRIGEAIRIGNDVSLTVLSNKQGRVSLGIAAPTSTRILRSELLPDPVEPEQANQRPSDIG